MNTYIALLRGINVGGHKKVPMAELRELLTKARFHDVRTYIQSGNVILQSSEKNLQNIESTIQNSILNNFGFTVPVIVRTRAHIKSIFDNCPFPEEEKINSYFTLLSEVPKKSLVTEASKKVYLEEAYCIVNDCIYFYCASGYGRAKFNLNYFEKKLEVNATARNYKTMLKLLSIAAEIETNL
jgi:uncharacterized protein (DUF1697 family)